ncbi:unnamed protein product [Microthlaspi erraticum]|uniref:Uncharacterized protein n=1 Tax=Microthlaspi erraticum TaxID=1685480 RepID=A0A6D2INW4_9BRAS|nr:unnamed protein product [Microthlaspi erraticum]
MKDAGLQHRFPKCSFELQRIEDVESRKSGCFVFDLTSADWFGGDYGKMWMHVEGPKDNRVLSFAPL